MFHRGGHIPADHIIGTIITLVKQALLCCHIYTAIDDGVDAARPLQAAVHFNRL